MQIEVTEQTSNELHRRAHEAGVGVSEYLEALVLPKFEAARQGVKDPPTVEQLQAMLEKSSARLERNGRPWRELTHEGHKY